MIMIMIIKVGAPRSGRAVKIVFFVRELVIIIREVRGPVGGGDINASSSCSGTRVVPWAGIGGVTGGTTGRQGGHRWQNV